MLYVNDNTLNVTTTDRAVVDAFKVLHPSSIIMEDWSRTESCIIYDITINIVN